MNTRDIGLMLLRLGLASVFLWFGFSQLFNGIDWVAWVPAWAVALLHMPPAFIVLLNGLLEVVLGTALAMNLFVVPSALILAVHLGVIAFEIGFTAIGVRDFGLMFATFALAFLCKREESWL